MRGEGDDRLCRGEGGQEEGKRRAGESGAGREGSGGARAALAAAAATGAGGGRGEGACSGGVAHPIDGVGRLVALGSVLSREEDALHVLGRLVGEEGHAAAHVLLLELLEDHVGEGVVSEGEGPVTGVVVVDRGLVVGEGGERPALVLGGGVGLTRRVRASGGLSNGGRGGGGLVCGYAPHLAVLLLPRVELGDDVGAREGEGGGGSGGKHGSCARGVGGGEREGRRLAAHDSALPEFSGGPARVIGSPKPLLAGTVDRTEMLEGIERGAERWKSAVAASPYGCFYPHTAALCAHGHGTSPHMRTSQVKRTSGCGLF